MTTRALVLSGGAFRGAVQVPVMSHLAQDHEYDAVYGVSVGALNGVLFAQGQTDLVWNLWNDVRKVGDFLKISCWPFNGLYSMKPLRKKIEQYADLAKIKIPFSAGLISLNNKEYYSFCTTNMSKNKELWDAIQSSASISGLMKSPEIEIDGEIHKGADGGFRNIVPIPVGTYDYIDVVPCTPLDRGNMKEPKQWNTLSLLARGIEVMEDEVFDKDYLQVAAKLNPGGVMTIYAPLEDTGQQFEATPDIINKRFHLGEDAYRHPEILTYDDACLLSDLIRYDNDVVA